MACNLVAEQQHIRGKDWLWRQLACTGQSLNILQHGKNKKHNMNIYNKERIDLHLISPVSATTVVYFFNCSRVLAIFDFVGAGTRKKKAIKALSVQAMLTANLLCSRLG